MNYKDAKYFRQRLDLNEIILKTNFYFIFQLQAIKIQEWVLLKKEFANQNFKIRVLPIKLLRNHSLFNINLLQNIHKGNILIVYSSGYVLHNPQVSFMLGTVPFLIPLYTGFNNRYYLFDNFQILLQSDHLRLIQIMLQFRNLVKVLLYKNL
jgi:hypothetical protein